MPPRNTDLRAMPDQHDKSRNLPDPDIFAFDIGLWVLEFVVVGYLSNVKMSGSGRLELVMRISQHRKISHA